MFYYYFYFFTFLKKIKEDDWNCFEVCDIYTAIMILEYCNDKKIFFLDFIKLNFN